MAKAYIASIWIHHFFRVGFFTLGSGGGEGIDEFAPSQSALSVFLTPQISSPYVRSILLHPGDDCPLQVAAWSRVGTLAILMNVLRVH